MPHRALRRAALVAALLPALVLAAAHGASAHDRLVDSQPAADDHLDTAPDQVRLEFSADLLQVGAVVVLTDTATGETWRTDDPALDGPVVTAPVPAGLDDGTYEVRWRVVSSDGHAISGVVPFTVGDAVTGGPSAAGTPSPTAPPPADAASTPDASAVPAPGTATSAGTGPWRTVLVAVGGGILAVGLYTAVLAVRRRTRPTTPPVDVP